MGSKLFEALFQTFLANDELTRAGSNEDTERRVFLSLRASGPPCKHGRTTMFCPDCHEEWFNDAQKQ
jgi:hypothetical protein